MSLVTIAKHLEAHGRGKDNHLVHMTTDELKSLQHLAMRHGGSLTINPHTGLPEAGFLSSLLPMAIGAAAVATGNVELLPMIAGGVGVADYAMTGSLMKGLMAGLGTWGGGNIAESLASAGTQGVVQQGGDEAAKQFAQNQAQVNATQIPTETGTFNPQTLQVTNTPIPSTADLAAKQISGMSNLTPEQVQGFQQQLSVPGSTAADVVKSAAATNSAIGAQASPLSTMRAGFSNEAGTGIFNSAANAGNFAKNNIAGLTAAGTAVAENMQPKIPTAAAPDKNPFGLKSLAPDFKGTFPTPPSPGYQASYTNYVKNPYNPATAADGGLMKFSAGDAVEETQRGLDMAFKRPVEKLTHADAGVYQDTDPNTKDMDAYHAALYNIKKLGKVSNLPKGLSQIQSQGQLGAIANQSVPEQMAAAIAQQSIDKDNSKPVASKHGGLQHHHHKGLPMSDLGGYSDGGHLLKGPGDGVSDSIPATISGKQPARLADGEFVIPARIVSELGNGSTDAGAKRLYAMMDRIKAKRAKAKDIAADTKAYKYLPA